MTELGIQLRGTIADTTTYRVRRGNGSAGSVQGKYYQDIMAYYTPTNPQTPLQQAWRSLHADAIAVAKTLTEEQKAPLRVIAKAEGGRTWHNIFVREYLHVYGSSAVSNRAISGLALSGCPYV